VRYSKLPAASIAASKAAETTTFLIMALSPADEKCFSSHRSDRALRWSRWSNLLFNHKPGPVGANVDPLGLLPGRVLPEPFPAVLVVVDAMAGDVTAGTVGTSVDVPAVGKTPIVGTAAAELTPRLPISKDPSGIPVRAAPPGVVGDVDVGVDDEATLLEPEPHIPDNPDVSSSPEVVDIPDVADIPGDIDVAAVAGVVVPTVIPPPSKLAVDPNIPDGEVPKVEHVVPLLGIVMVPVTVGAGLTPGDAISVAPRGMPVGDTVEPVPKPSGEVASIVGVGVAMPLTCAMAALQATSAGRIAAINENLIGILRLKTPPPRRTSTSISFATVSIGARLSDIGQSPVVIHAVSEKSAAADVQVFVQRLVQPLLFCVEPRKPLLLRFVRWRIWRKVFGSRLNLNDRSLRRKRGCQTC
jgi:hypothetical protein